MNDEVFVKKSTIDMLITENLDQLSVSELKERIESLQSEIKRCNKSIKNKEFSKSVADSIFK